MIEQEMWRGDKRICLPPRLRCGIAENHKSFLKNKVQYHVLFCYLMPEMQMRCKVFSAMPHLDVSKYHSTLDTKCELRVFSRELVFPFQHKLVLYLICGDNYKLVSNESMRFNLPLWIENEAVDKERNCG